jgi:hypothetical protein
MVCIWSWLARLSAPLTRPTGPLTCRSVLDADAACERQPLRCSVRSLVESSWWPAVSRIRLLPRHQIRIQPGRAPRARRRPRPAPVGPSLASSR